ncbi:hypothetical protein K1T71_005308 [Dendrolimus kikuchii]|uniref:Uncharacterized protein n=1 Tax=Dendrolimus kikuchii TaxID=765133 RepID=A0ACC1D6K6_9NEOP|nr:hypothetical protein K1T71_005308 [Dendrolimus kikuchii]
MDNTFSYNVTYRKPRLSSSLNNITNESQLFDTTILSLPNTSMEDSRITKDYIDQINKLKEDLHSANQEIENLNLENITLNRGLEKKNKIIDLYKKVNDSDTNMMKKKANRKSLNTQPISCCTPKKGPICVTSGNQNGKTYDSNEETSVLLANKNNNIEVTATESRQKLEKMPSHSHKTNFTLQKDKNGDKKKIVIIADQQGKHTQHILQHLAGAGFQVTCFFKPGARVKNVVKTELDVIQKLGKKDYVVLLGGINDDNPAFSKKVRGCASAMPVAGCRVTAPITRTSPDWLPGPFLTFRQLKRQKN